MIGIKGKNKAGTERSHSGRIEQIVTAKGYDPILYRIHYYVMPTFIIIDEKDGSRAVHCTFHPALRNMLVNRSADIALRMLQGGRAP